MTTPTLTDRYLHAAARGAPESQRDSLRRELAERIGDDVDARIDAGANPADAERLALVELGDPDVLVATYLDRPQYLIGPRLFPVWKRILRVLALTVIPVVALAFPFAQVLAQKPIGEIIGSTVVVLIALCVHLVFWVTLVFAVLDRALGGKPIMEWTPDSLPVVTEPPGDDTRGDVVLNLAFVALFALGILGHPVLLPFRDAEGEKTPLFQPDTWAWLQWYLIALLVLELGFWIRLRGRWSYGFAAGSAVLSLAFAIPLAWALADDRLFNHEFLARTGWDEWPEILSAGGGLAVTLAFLVVAVSAVWPIDGFLKARRAAASRAGASVHQGTAGQVDHRPGHGAGTV
ncbi:permease prefix domain 1-containing protein [Promicromonospora vindobonensis]|uniref:Permease prefix domain 1-containing protein n=1 Tax=Promicromonospora vindobonensis TaxID=195748 RepID=A0ABW5W1R4_9MICO